MLFYEIGCICKKFLGEQDIQIIVDLMEKIKFYQVYVVGDLVDLYGIYVICLEAIFQVYDWIKEKDWVQDVWLWFYCGVWYEWLVYEIEMAVFISLVEFFKKWDVIFMYQF